MRSHAEIMIMIFPTSSQDGITSLYRACQNGYSNIVDVLLKAGGDPNIADEVSAITFS